MYYVYISNYLCKYLTNYYCMFLHIFTYIKKMDHVTEISVLFSYHPWQ